jgi:hypothetical protein
MIKKLYVVGDSWFVNSWPDLLASNLDLKLINEAVEGSSNDWIFRKCIEWISCQEKLDDVFIIVGVTSPHRREENFNNYHPGKIYENDKISNFIYKYLYNNELQHYKSVSYLIALQNLFISKNIKYLFFDPWYDILQCESELIEQRKTKKWNLNYDTNIVSQKDFSNPESYVYWSEKLNIGKMLTQINKDFYITPDVVGGKSILRTDDGHPNEKECVAFANILKQQIQQRYVV